MKKYSNISKSDVGSLLETLCQSLVLLNNATEIMNLLTDLLTREEMIMLAKRIKTAQLLIEGKGYREIQDKLHISHQTIAKVNQWLLESGEGFRLVAKRNKKEFKEKSTKTGSQKLIEYERRRNRKRYPIMFWPQLLIEDIVKTMNKSQKEKIKRTVEKLDHKSKIYKQLSKNL
ncbi:hypothetical protein KKC65_00720 [Patescibacteria group bacterium]|nr:hypothetical protein [Patescibacteria group bacterium]